MKTITRPAFTFALAALIATAGIALSSDNGPHTTSMFQGPKANTGTAIHTIENGKSVLRVSSDFKVPDTPAPTWRVVDSNGNIYVVSGNGTFDTTASVPPVAPNNDFGQSFLKLSTSSGLALADFFTLFNYSSANTSDFDFGSGESFYKRFFSTGKVDCAEVYYFPIRVKPILMIGLLELLDATSALITRVVERLGLKEKLKNLLRLGLRAG